MAATVRGGALITGSTSGIGEAIAHELAAAGARVVVTGRNADRGEAVLAAIAAAGGKATFVAADLAGGVRPARHPGQHRRAGAHAHRRQPGASGDSPPLIAAVPSRRIRSPQEVAAAVRFLASDDSANINGATLTIDGGYTAL